jgi:acyl-CoA thioester hydrolase
MIEVVEEKRVGVAGVRVRYAETDQMGVVYHSNYLIWFEVGRVELIRSMGLDYKRMEVEEGCGIAVVDVHVRYRAPARYDDELAIRCCGWKTGCCCARVRLFMSWWARI